MKLASGQLRPTLGQVKIGERDAWSTGAKRDLGYSPDTNAFYERMSARRFVYTMTCLYGYPRGEARQRTEEALTAVGMRDRADRKLAGCSHGMRQRVKLAQALAHDPPILLLDEPMTGIDPGGRREFKTLLRTQADRGKTILVSTHILNEVEDLADSILVIARGRLIARGTLDEVRSQIKDQPLTVGIGCDSARRLAALLIESETIASLDLRGGTLIIRTEAPPEFFTALGEIVTAHDFDVRKVEILDAGAEAVYDYLVGNGQG
jgi:ABC-2 type transport system ATP-binding protein